MPKLTLPQILALARAAGHDLGGPTADGVGIIAQLRAELAEAKCELDGARSLLSQSIDETNRLRRIIDARPPFQAFDHAVELAEARAEVVALTRTCDKLRVAVLQADGARVIGIGSDPVEAAAQAVEGRQDAPGSTIDPSKVLLVRFAGAQGYGTADKLKALGARWTWDPKQPGEPRSTSGAWRVPASPEALALLEALRADGRTLTVSA